MPAQPVYFGDPVRSLAGWLHLPDEGMARGGVLLCAPIGREHVFSYPALRTLAEQLAANGLVALRFDYDGTGDSAGGLGDPDRLSSWQASVRTGLTFLRSTGVTAVSVVGLRLGALLAVTALQDERLQNLVLWDPQLSGRRFLREQKVLVRVTTSGVSEPEPDGAVHGHSAVFPPQVAADLSLLSGDALTRPIADQLLVLHRPDNPGLTDGVRQLAGTATSLEILEQEAMLEVDPPRPALDAVALIVAELTEAHTGTAVSVRVPPHRTEAVMHDRDGRPVVERFWRSRSGLLFGVTTSHPDAVSAEPIALLLPSGVGHRVGVGRLWVEVARECAADTVTAVRIDLSGLGDSGIRPGRAPGQMYTQDAVDDVVEAATDLAPDDPSAVRLIGHCSGAWAGLKAAAVLQPRSLHAVSLHPYSNLYEWQVLAQGEAVIPRRTLRGRLLRLGRKPWVERHRARVPAWAWTLLDRSGLLPSPMHEVEALITRGTRVHIVSDQLDGAFYLADAKQALRRLPADRFELELLPVSDHALASAIARQQVAQALLRNIVPLTSQTPHESRP